MAPRRRRSTAVFDGNQVVALIASNAALEEGLGNLREAFDEERNGAAEYRRDLRQVIGALSGSVRELTATVAELKPLVDDYRTNRDQARGAAKLAVALKGGVLGLCAAGGAMVHKLWP